MYGLADLLLAGRTRAPTLIAARDVQAVTGVLVRGLMIVVSAANGEAFVVRVTGWLNNGDLKAPRRPAYHSTQSPTDLARPPPRFVFG